MKRETANRTRWQSIFALGVFFVAGCGGGPQPADTATPAKESADRPAADGGATSAPIPPTAAPELKAVAGTATVTGRVTYRGTPPKPKALNFGAEKVCQGYHATPPTDESLVVHEDGSLQWVLVRVSGRVRGDFPPPSQPVVLDQKGCIFSPHTLAVQKGQVLEIRNSDDVLHNVRCETRINQPFNRNLPRAGDSATVTFDTAELGIRLKCDVHFWMSGNLHVIAHPFFAVSGSDGRFAIERLPPGDYKLEAWHEKLGEQTAKITVTADEVKTVDFSFAAES